MHKKRTSQQKNTSWGNVASWYDSLLKDEDSYQAKVIAPNLLRLLGDIKRKTVLDLACGQGFFSNLFHKEGASVTGVDIAPELIAFAKSQSPKEISYAVTKAHNLSSLPKNYFDHVVCILAIQNIEEVPKVLLAVKTVLKKKGVLHLVLNHPAFRIPKESSWEFDEKTKEQYRRINAYLSEKKISIDMTPGKKAQKTFTISFHRSLQYFFKVLKNNNFAVTNLEEWISHKESAQGTRQKAENKARKEIPLFLYLQAVQFDA